VDFWTFDGGFIGKVHKISELQMFIRLDSTDSGNGHEVKDVGVKTKKKRKTHKGKTMKIAEIPFMCLALGAGEIIKKRLLLVLHKLIRFRHTVMQTATAVHIDFRIDWFVKTRKKCVNCAKKGYVGGGVVVYYLVSR